MLRVSLGVSRCLEIMVVTLGMHEGLKLMSVYECMRVSISFVSMHA